MEDKVKKLEGNLIDEEDALKRVSIAISNQSQIE